MEIKTVIDSRRGCGWRKPGGLYLVSGGLTKPCGKLPFLLIRCPCCGAGIKPTRGWTWIAPPLLFSRDPCESVNHCKPCSLGGAMPDKAGLLWIGEQFYATPDSFTKEALRLGISRRISQVPKDFKVGMTWVFLAHRKTYIDGTFAPAIFHAFLPDKIQYVVTGKEMEAELAAIVERGITPVIVRRNEEQQELEVKGANT